RFYFDEMMSRTAAKQLLAQSTDVVLAVDVGMMNKPDDLHLQYASNNGLVLVTFDRPFAGRTAKLLAHGGLVCLSGDQNNIGYIVTSLLKLSGEETIESVKGRVFWL